jgi:RNA polymerase sigma-70 factor (family 1)
MTGSNTLNAEDFKSIFNLYYPGLCAFAGRFVEDAEDAKDIVSGIFLKLWVDRSILRKDLNVKGYLYATARNACIDFLRSDKRKKDAHQQLVALLSEEYFFSELLKMEVLREIYAEISLLPEQCRTIFQMLYIEGLSYGEVATQLNLSEQTIRNQKARAILLLKRKLFPDSVFMAAAAAVGAGLITLLLLLVFYIINYHGR